MKKEISAVVILGLFILAYVLNTIAGPVSISINSPLEFIDQAILTKYPFTAVAIVVQTLAVFSAILLVFSFFEKKMFTKGVILLIVAALSELYVIQQLATGMLLIPIQWTLTIAANGVLLVIPAVLFIIFGFFSVIIDKTLGTVKAPGTDKTGPEKENKTAEVTSGSTE